MSDTVDSFALVQMRSTARIAEALESSFLTETVSESGGAETVKRPISEHTFAVNMGSRHRFNSHRTQQREERFCPQKERREWGDEKRELAELLKRDREQFDRRRKR